MKQRSNFLLSKWYMDCVSEAGGVFIGYAATLRWRQLSINYASTLEQRFGEPTRSRTSLPGFSPPEYDGSSLKWTSATLEVNGSWNVVSQPVESTIYESDLGSIKWHCIAPIADTEINTQYQPFLKGLGYAEHLTLTIPPWQLPMDELRWGRFLSDRCNMTWIDWRGPHPLTLVFLNGAAIEDAEVTDNEIRSSNGRLAISTDRRRTLREGALVNAALAAIPGIKHVIPGRILDAYESKWCSGGTFSKPGDEDIGGWVIHEIVRWGR